jgi:hypothetical protein
MAPSRLRQRLHTKPWGTWKTVIAAIGTYLAILGFFALGAVLALRVGLSSDRGATVITALFCLIAYAVLLIATVMLSPRATAVGVARVMTLPIVLAGLGISLSVPGLVLLSRGHEITAAVVESYRDTSGRGAPTYDYTLRAANGTSIAGRLATSDRSPRPAGDLVDVVVDPKGAAAPAFATDLAHRIGWTIVIGVLGLLAIAACITFFAASGERHRRRSVAGAQLESLDQQQ